MSWQASSSEGLMYAEQQVAARNSRLAAAEAEPSEFSRSLIVNIASSLVAAGIVAAIIVDQMRHGAPQEGGQHA